MRQIEKSKNVVNPWGNGNDITPWKFEYLMQFLKIFFVAFIQRKGHLRVSFLRWLGHCRFKARSASEATQN